MKVSFKAGIASIFNVTCNMQQLLYVFIFLMFPCFLFSQDNDACKSYHEGYMEYNEKALFGDVIVYRKGNTQIEYTPKDETYLLLEVVWQSDCEYTIRYMNSNWDEADPFLGETTEVEIIKATKEYYRYKALVGIGDKKTPIFGRMNHLSKKKVPKQTRKEIQKILDLKKGVQEYPVKT